jgi:hypothetical protein
MQWVILLLINPHQTLVICLSFRAKLLSYSLIIKIRNTKATATRELAG